ncbi:porin [Paraburkholderia sediminicola]|uniref:Porin n=1 Tax=Paraburkholderia rhynchosiae TaxID=487049 RepID=A0ACC7NGD9_9BURK
MKKRMWMAALSAAGAASVVPGLAHAQSSVTLYGIIDTGINYVSNAGGQHQYAMSSGYNSGSRFGFRGTEDLGDGLKTVFDLENGFDNTTGKASQGGLLFGRQAYVGLSSRTAGTVTLGRQYDLVVDEVGRFAFAALGGGSSSAHSGDIDNLHNTYRINNAVKYVTPTIGGFRFGALYGLGGVSGDASRNQVISAGMHYVYGAFAAGAGYVNARNPNISFFGTSSQTTLTAATTNATSPAFSGFLSAHTYQDIAVGASYRFGKATIAGTYSNIAFKGVGDTTSGPNPSHYSGTAVFNDAEVSVQYDLGHAIRVGMAYDYLKGNGIDSNPGAIYNQVAANAAYYFSKRTSVYLVGVYQHASGTDSRGKAAVAAMNQQTASTSASQSLVRIGLRTVF